MEVPGPARASGEGQAPGIGGSKAVIHVSIARKPNRRFLFKLPNRKERMGGTAFQAGKTELATSRHKAFQQPGRCAVEVECAGIGRGQPGEELLSQGRIEVLPLRKACQFPWMQQDPARRRRKPSSGVLLRLGTGTPALGVRIDIVGSDIRQATLLVGRQPQRGEQRRQLRIRRLQYWHQTRFVLYPEDHPSQPLVRRPIQQEFPSPGRTIEPAELVESTQRKLVLAKGLQRLSGQGAWNRSGQEQQGFARGEHIDLSLHVFTRLSGFLQPLLGPMHSEPHHYGNREEEPEHDGQNETLL